jgi:hypothetical protein
MLFHVTWEFIDTSEDGIRRSLAVFSKWQPPHWRRRLRGCSERMDRSGTFAISAHLLAQNRLRAIAEDIHLLNAWRLARHAPVQCWRDGRRAETRRLRAAAARSA